MAKAQIPNERDEAIAKLREILPPGTTVYTILRHVSRSYMQRSLSVVIPTLDLVDEVDHGDGSFTAEFHSGITDITHWARKALDGKFDREHGGIICRGAGMDMGWHLVSNLSRVLYPEGFGCIGPSCPANDHVNGDRDYILHGEEPDLEDRAEGHGHWHSAGDYALRMVWL